MTGIVHVVLVEWNTEDAAVPERATALAHEHLPGIGGVVSVASGPSVSPEGKEEGFDWMLVVRFRDAAARDAYLPHPAHTPVAEHIGAHNARVVVFDVAA
ncbi:Dabb family protein [Curtobacterium sp. MCBD17_032]|uniref:Dabb family protein n=1 Tax=Curtobacterium sp. MCBD17_032 TaxID=2175659 RepID=UPI000DA7194B|nr:Dabb family protein [Curtobacterium sp. MCBD17_032]PZE86832.1 Dabb family protein [Curtobacterium sp. MCBD17_032]